MTRTIAYLRVSTDKQADHGVSLEAQEAKVRAYATLYDLDLVSIEVDAGESAKSLHRPALQRALASLKAGRADALLVVKLDRLTRSVRDLCDLVERYFQRAALLSVGEQIDTRSAAGRMVLNMLATVGQWEREVIGERTAIAMAHLKQQGKYTGGVAPYGFTRTPEGDLMAVAGEAAIIAEGRRLRAHGLSLRAIAATLEEVGLVSRTGTRFAPSAIASWCEGIAPGA